MRQKLRGEDGESELCSGAIESSRTRIFPQHSFACCNRTAHRSQVLKKSKAVIQIVRLIVPFHTSSSLTANVRWKGTPCLSKALLGRYCEIVTQQTGNSLSLCPMQTDDLSSPLPVRYRDPIMHNLLISLTNPPNSPSSQSQSAINTPPVQPLHGPPHHLPLHLFRSRPPLLQPLNPHLNILNMHSQRHPPLSPQQLHPSHPLP